MLVQGELFSGVNGKRVDSDPLSPVVIVQFVVAVNEGTD
jgi:hypothetical protein